MKRNWEAVVLKAMGGRDFRLTVLDTQQINSCYHRVEVDGGGLLESRGVHPTMWIRLWFENNGQPHQRAYTVVDPEPETGRFSLEFAIHDGPAAQWSLHAQPGDTIGATVQGSAFALPDPAPSHLYIAGDPAALPAVNSLLDETNDTPATIWLEYQHEAEKDLPVRTKPHHELTWVPRENGGDTLTDTVCATLPGTDDAFYWVACETAATRTIAKHVRRRLGVDKRRVHALGYWRAA